MFMGDKKKVFKKISFWNKIRETIPNSPHISLPIIDGPIIIRLRMNGFGPRDLDSIGVWALEINSGSVGVQIRTRTIFILTI